MGHKDAGVGFVREASGQCPASHWGLIKEQPPLPAPPPSLFPDSRVGRVLLGMCPPEDPEGGCP